MSGHKRKHVAHLQTAVESCSIFTYEGKKVQAFLHLQECFVEALVGVKTIYELRLSKGDFIQRRLSPFLNSDLVQDG